METVEDGAPKFGKAKLLTRELPESMTADEFQVILGKEMTLARCAKSRKTPVFVKKNAPGLSSKPAEKEFKRVKAPGTRADDVGPAIRPLSQRLDTDGKGTFDMQDFWRAKEGALPAWAKVLGAVLCHVPNSAPPERAFSILNNSIGDDQYAALADYKKALIQVQYNSRRRGN